MKKVVAFILLLCHMNTSMFLPQVAESDRFDSSGQQIDDINSVVEYVDQIILGHRDRTPEDEDNDDGQNFTLATNINYYVDQPFVVLEHPEFEKAGKRNFFEYSVPKISFVSYDIVVPPPKA